MKRINYQKSSLLLVAITFTGLIFVMSSFDSIDAQELSLAVNKRVFIDEQSLVINGQTMPADTVIIRLFGPDETIKVFEQIVASDSGSFNYEFIWPKDSVDFPYDTYTIEAINMSQGDDLSEKIEVRFTTLSELRWYSDFTDDVICASGAKLVNGECQIIQWSIGQIQWLETSYPATGTGIVQVIDPDMNLDPKAVDNFDVDVWSESDFAGIDLTVSETDKTTGIFEGTVFFTVADDSSGHRLRIAEGDTITVRYNDYTIPELHSAVNGLDMTNTAIILGNSSLDFDTTISLDKKFYTWDDTVNITIISLEHNIARDSVDVIENSEPFPLKVKTRHFEFDDYQFVETNTDTGIFTGKIALENVPEDYIFEEDGISVFFEFAQDKTAIGSAPIISQSEKQISKQKVSPPLKQIKNGVDLWSVQCNDNLFLMLKPATFTKPVCVTESTMKELTERDWRPVIIGSTT